MNIRDALIYVVDDDDSAREAIVGLAHAAGYQAVGLASAAEFLSYCRPTLPGCLVLDMHLPGVSGLDLQRQLNAANDALPIVFVSGHGDVRSSVAAIKAGAVDFLTKPFDVDALLEAIQRAVPDLDSEPLGNADRCSLGSAIPGIVGSSAALLDVLKQVQTVAGTDATVLIQGETGTGKERIARAVHDSSDRRAGPFITVSCAAIPAALLESELMGHEKGAFTGAIGQRLGRFELARNGTIFLDEIGELPIDLQPKLLRILQEREFERLGGSRTIRPNVRVIAATHRDLRAMAVERTFRADLYYRLSVFPITVPPLRERVEDIPLLAQHFLEQVSARMHKQVAPISLRSLENLVKYRWPGNIRELQNVIERGVILSSDGSIQISDLGAGLALGEVSSSSAVEAPAEAPRLAAEALNGVNKAHILRILKETNWVIGGPGGAAARLEMNRSTLNFRMKKLGISRRPIVAP